MMSLVFYQWPLQIVIHVAPYSVLPLKLITIWTGRFIFYVLNDLSLLFVLFMLVELVQSSVIISDGLLIGLC